MRKPSSFFSFQLIEITGINSFGELHVARKNGSNEYCNYLNFGYKTKNFAFVLIDIRIYVYENIRPFGPNYFSMDSDIMQ